MKHENKKPAYRKRHLFARTLSTVTEALTTPMLDGKQQMLRMIIKDWSHIVGADLAEHSRPTKLHFQSHENTGGILHLQVAAHKAPEIPYLSPQMLEALARHIGFRAIDRIVVDPAPKQ